MKNNIKVETHVTFLEAQSSAQSNQYAFAYTITITNKGDIGAQLLTRFWQIKDESGDMEEVVGEGVIGMQPHIAPGESFQYSSGAVIKTLTGSMYGSYGMINDDGDRFDAEIPEFILTKPYTLH
ncbi:MAG: Co2+/Mg2+ efflux protein ApaG [PS1 clade bacterium]